MGVVSNHWFDRVLLSVLYMLKPSCLTDDQTPFLGTPSLPLKRRRVDTHACSWMRACRRVYLGAALDYKILRYSTVYYIIIQYIILH